MLKTIWSCWGSLLGQQVCPWVGIELLLILEERQSKCRNLFRNTLLSPSGDCCHVSDVLIYHLQVALMEDLRIYIKAMQSNACHLLSSKWHHRTRRAKYFQQIHDLINFNKAFQPKELMSLSLTSTGAQIKEVNLTNFLGWDHFSLK